MHTSPLVSVSDPDWLALRLALWPDASPAEHLEEMATFLAEPDRFSQFIARDVGGSALGFVEASIRTDYVNGTESTPVAFLEGLFVSHKARRKGVARILVASVAAWAKAMGYVELASDAPTRNRASHAVHRQLGFVETERVVYFTQRLR